MWEFKIKMQNLAKTIVTFIVLFMLVPNLKGQFRPLVNKKHNINEQIKKLISYPDFNTAGFAFYAIDVNSGEVIAMHNPNMALKPASTQKLFSTATALELLGSDYQFQTLLQYTGYIDTSTRILHGDIIIKGGGDPTLGSKYFNQTKSKQFLSQWLKAVKALGIDSITGSIIGDAQIYSLDIVPPTWSWLNMGNYFGAGACGLSIYDNYYSIHFKTGIKPGDSTLITMVNPEIPQLVFDNGVFSDSIHFDNTNIFGAPYANNRYIRGSLPLGKTDFAIKGSTPDPAFLAAVEFFRAIKNGSIGIGGEATTKRRLSIQHAIVLKKAQTFDTLKSPILDSIIRLTNENSINHFAEHCLMQSALQLGVQAQVDSATKAIENFWKSKGMDIKGLLLNDGSGLSHYNLITPKQLVFLLQYMKNKSTNFNAFYNSLSIAGETGTLEHLCKNTSAQGNLRAKSGSLNLAKAYSGFVTSKSGREIAFSMVINNYSGSAYNATKQLEKLMVAIAVFDK